MSGGLAGAGYALAWHGSRGVPEPLVQGAFRVGAEAAGRRGGEKVRQLRRNLARAAPEAGEVELDALVRAGLRSYARYWAEAFRLPAMDWPAVRERCAIAGLEHFDAAVRDGRGVVVALTHSGNWDVAGLWLARSYGRFTTVVERLRPEPVYRRFVAYRESLGFEILPADAGRVTALTLLSRLRAGGVVSLVADRDFSGTGTLVSFFGEPARLPTGPARLATRTGAALVPVGSAFTASGWHFRVHPPVPVAAGVHRATQALAECFACDIAAHPADWHMLQPVFAADRPEAGRSAG